MPISFAPIGIIHTPFHQQSGTPIQSVYAEGAEGTVEVYESFAEGLADLEGFERIWLIFFCDRASTGGLKVVPYRDTELRGVFSTRAPSRPNRIAISPVRLLAVEGSRVRVADVDMLDGTPLLDIKPYLPRCDSFPDARSGWFGRGGDRTRADRRFADDNNNEEERK